jgi:DNA-binding PadR family transcriptional regulator
MLSKLATLILGILAERERNPYDITKMLGDLKTKKWLPMADSTVYATINILKKKELIVGRIEKDGNLPEKTIYSITNEGEYELHASVTSYLEEDLSSSSGFDIGILLMHNLSKQEIQIKLKKKLERLEASFYVIRKQILGFEMDSGKIAFTALSMLKHRQHLIESEIKTVKELIRDLNTRVNISDISPFDMRMM